MKSPRADPGPQAPAGEAYLYHQPAGEQHGARGGYPSVRESAEGGSPVRLAPTSSTTAALVMGDALAVALLEARGFTAEDFALSHPGGALGRKLLLRVNDIMHTGDEIPHVGLQATLRDALLEITRKI